MTAVEATTTAGALRVHVAERSDVLVDALATLLAQAPADPFTPDVVLVPTRGVERWVAQRLSHRLGAGPGGDGICANVRFSSPARAVSDVLARVLGTSPDEDPWAPERVAWHVLGVLDDAHGDPLLATPVGHLGDPHDDVRQGRRLRLAQRLAGLLSSYDAQRPDVVRAWAHGRDEDGAGAPLPADLVWQAHLWRLVRERVGAPSPAQRLDDALDALAADPALVDLPARLSVLGATRLPDAHVRVLAALARHRDVHLWLPHPSLPLWRAVADVAPTDRRRRGLPVVASHPLLASMAGDAVELQVRLAPLAPTVTLHDTPSPPATALGALQARVRADAADGPRQPVAPDDRTVQVHACHGRHRQVEVLREAVLGLLADDPTLQPRDVVVMCPDVEAFAPLVSATFGDTGPAVSGREHPGRRLRVRVADRAPARANPLLAFVATLLELAGSRVTASAVVDLAGLEPVRRRFGFDDVALDRLRSWALQAGVRWGEDVTRRERYRLGAVAQGTWAAALDRLLLGVAMAEEEQRYVGAVLPVDDVDSTDVDLVGRVAELLDRLTHVLHELDGTRPATAWLDTVERALRLLTDVAPQDRWQQVEAARVLGEVRLAADRHARDLRLPDLVALLEPHLRGRPTRAGFRTGALTVCSLEPMRAVPHRVVVLLGIDDGVFPRGSGRDGDDLLARDPLVGERDRRTEDRRLFLDAVTSATEHLVVLHSGADERTGAPRPPAVPVGELLDALDDAVDFGDGRDAREHVVVHHPLQTVDERNFVAGALGRPGPFSFDALDLAAARAGRGDRVERGPFVPEPLPPADPVDDVGDLADILTHPVRAFVRRRLRAVPPRETEQLDDRLPLELDPLERWDVGRRLLEATLDGASLDDAVAAERRRGHVPPGSLGSTTLLGVAESVRPLLDAVDRWRTGEARTRDVRLALPDGRALAGTVGPFHGDVLLSAVYSRLAPKHRLRAWVLLLAAAADHGADAGELRAVTVGRGPGGGARVSEMRAPARADAAAVLADLADLADAALREPLPLPLSTSCAYGHARWSEQSVDDALAAARKELGTLDDSRNGRGGFEVAETSHALVWGEGFTLDAVAGLPSAADAARWPDDTTRFGALSRTLWEPMLTHETIAMVVA